MDENKKWYESRTVWGSAVVLLATAAGAFGFVVDEAIQGQLVDHIMAAITAAGGIVAIWGRIKASKKIE